MIAVGAALALLAQADIDFPLRPGARWVYVHDGRESLILDALETSEIGAKKTVTLRIRGPSFFWGEGDLFLSADSQGLRNHGSRYLDEVHPRETPSLFLPSRLEQGTRWEGPDGFGFKAVVKDVEPLAVPAGTFRSWKIEYRASTSETSVDAWYAPGTGFVRLDFLKMSDKKPWGLEATFRYDLARFEPTRKIEPLVVPALSGEERKVADILLRRLADQDVDTREKAAADLFALGRGVIPMLREALEKASDPEVRPRLRQVVDRFPALEYRIHLERAHGKVGKPLPIRFALRNLTPEPLRIVQAIQGSAFGRSPRYLLTILDEQGVEQQLPKSVGCGSSNRLLQRNFVTLEPGEEFDPMGPGTWKHPMQFWTPTRPGIYTVDAVYDATGKIPEAWEGTAYLEPVVRKQIEAMPRGRYEAKRLTIVVEP